jgi:hypothetical protein
VNAQEAAARNRERARRLKERIADNIRRGAGKGIEAAGMFLASRVRDALNVSAPKRRLPGGGYVVTQRATPGAPMRKVTGVARRSVYSQLLASSTRKLIAVVGMNARSPKGFNYPRHWEYNGHPVLKPMSERYADALKTIVGAEIKMGFR